MLYDIGEKINERTNDGIVSEFNLWASVIVVFFPNPDNYFHRIYPDKRPKSKQANKMNLNFLNLDFKIVVLE